ncbi:G-type lectin S-receptor-like serine/threonine-protein kinase At2g19130 [Miscanthus floridulus]|uniref:G-type lectin S-receptor-like serine/threonine-protein kinase At2g19130 n=1 Tax=Miscanthus floridulus TaxID=154761 RepID=UPI003459CCA1
MLPPYYTLFWLLFSLGYSSPACAAAYSNTLMTGEALIAGERLISSNGKFALGFFQTGSSKYSGNITLPNWYLGIWFNKIPKFTVVWVANRDKPITEPSLNQSIKLTVSGDGKLVLINHVTNSEIWSTQIGNRTKTSTNITAVLSDNGNLVVQDASKPARIWWQSFDHPTDVILPGGKIGRNKVTGLMYSLVSKMNSVDPSSGSYCMELDPSSPKQYVDKLCNTSIVYFSTGEWNGQYFTSVPEMSGNAFATAKFVETHEEEYLTYYTFDETVTTICLLDSDGLTKQLLWVSALQDWEMIYVQPKASCDVFAVCGPFTVCNDNALPMCICMTGFSVKSPKDWSLNDRRGGCIRNNILECSKNKSTKESTDQFFSISSVRLPYDAQAMEAVPTVQECMEVCLRDCNCTGYSYSKGVCSIWQGDLVNVKQYNGTTGTNGEILYLRLAAEELQSWENSGRRKMIIGVAFGASLSSLVLFVLVILLIIRRNKRKLCDHPNKIKDGGGVLAFGYVDLQRATNNFSEKLGGGGFGNVFKGILNDSNTIAVKTLDGARQGDKQFRAEISTIGMIQHVNLVKLIGFCCERDKRMLVYEHMVNRSLDAHLFRSTGTLLNWSTRYKIAIGIAKGLSYLHENCRDCIIHCDVKPENILLDEAFVPKIADFGMAKLVGREFSRVLTTMRGTVGYLAPEWISGVAITQKVDVYSYGMVLLEIISGRRNSLVECTSNGDQAIYFPMQAASKLIQGDVQSLLDQQLQGEINMHEVETACKVACWCIQESEFYRPTMGEVVQVLEGLVDVSMPPMPRLLQTILGSSAAP